MGKASVVGVVAELDPEWLLREGRRISCAYPPEFAIELDDPVDEGEAIASRNIVYDEGAGKENIDLVEVVVIENENESRPEQEHDEEAGIWIGTSNHDEREAEEVVHLLDDHHNPIHLERVVGLPWLVSPHPIGDNTLPVDASSQTL